MLRVARFNHVTAAVRWLADTTRRHATPDEVMRMLHAVDAAATLIPVRVACLERSLTAVVLLAARRRGVTWQLGVRTPPLATHAWLVDATGKPIDEPLTTAAYRPLITVSPQTLANRSMT
ncbi:MAG: lasso peptide biosynthesis B2 protein [Pseudonocardiales bacterium]|nr:lasso peptide biosynthesis B2 protein [Pseudonocardiales bacterium]